MTNNPDYIYLKRYGNSMQRLIKRYPDGCPAHIIASALDITEEQVEERYQEVVTKLQDRMGF
jgi:hypothetical protein